jgi:predicted RNase H-like HicB family nuclease
MVNSETAMAGQLKIVVEKHPDGYVAYPLGINGVVVGEGDTYEEALADVRSAIRFHMETFAAEVFTGESSSMAQAPTPARRPPAG